jgi:hypothetical protein
LVVVSVVAEVSGTTSHGESWFRLGMEPLEFNLEVCLLAAVALPACGDSCNKDILTIKTDCNSSGTLNAEVHHCNKLSECSMVQAIYSDTGEKKLYVFMEPKSSTSSLALSCIPAEKLTLEKDGCLLGCSAV